MKPYDEEAEVTRYVWQHYRAFFTPVERKTDFAMFADQKAAAGSPHVKEDIWRRNGIAEDDAVLANLALGIEPFRRQAARRVLAAHAEGVFLNRCPVCRRLVRTPLAQQCFWCGHNWHCTLRSPAAT